MILRPGDLGERTGAKMHRGQAGGSAVFFYITKLMMIETNEKWANFHDPSYSN